MQQNDVQLFYIQVASQVVLSMSTNLAVSLILICANDATYSV